MWKKSFLILFALSLIFNACAPVQDPVNSGAQQTQDSQTQSTPKSDLLTASGDSQEIVVHWQRSGGFAGICQEMDIYADGHTVVRDCGTGRELASGDLSEQERVLLKDWLESYQQFSWKFSPPKGGADMFLDEYTFSGIGEQLLPAQREESVNNELASIAQTLLQQPSK